MRFCRLGRLQRSGLLRRVDVVPLDEAGLGEAIAAAAGSAERGLSPAAGVMLQAVWLDGGASRSGRLLLSIHHLAVDGVSWRILVPDLAQAWSSVAAGRAIALPERGTSLRRWSERLAGQGGEPRWLPSWGTGAGC